MLSALSQFALYAHPWQPLGGEVAGGIGFTGFVGFVRRNENNCHCTDTCVCEQYVNKACNFPNDFDIILGAEWDE